MTKEHQQTEPTQFQKFLIPACIALPFNLTILRESTYGTCRAVTEPGECPHAKRKNKTNGKYLCDKNTLMPLDEPIVPSLKPNVTFN